MIVLHEVSYLVI